MLPDAIQGPAALAIIKIPKYSRLEYLASVEAKWSNLADNVSKTAVIKGPFNQTSVMASLKEPSKGDLKIITKDNKIRYQNLKNKIFKTMTTGSIIKQTKQIPVIWTW